MNKVATEAKLSEAVLIDGASRSMCSVRHRAARAAAGLIALGVREGDAVGLLLRNDFAFLEASIAATEIGAYPLPVNWHLVPAEVEYILQDAAPRVLIAHADLLAAIRHVVPAGTPLLTVPTPEPMRAAYHLAEEAGRPASGDTEWEAWCDGFEPWPGPPRRPRATMIYTSGTTGQPKGVRREAASPEMAEANRALIASTYGVRPGMRAYIGGPLYHASPNAFGRMSVGIGDLLAMQSRFDAEGLLALIERQRLTHLVMVPAMFVRLMKLPEEVRRRYDVSSLEWVTHTGSPCPPEVKRALIAWWGPVVHELYGGTETGAAVHCNSEEWLAHPGTVGRPVPGTTLRILGEDGSEVAPGTPGEIFMRCSAYTDFTYHNLPEKRREVERDGLITCGDIGYIDEDGFLYLCDRKRDMIIVGGVNIYPAEIESALLQHPGVRDCAVFGVPDDELGESIMAIVEPAGTGLTPEELLGFLGPRIARQKHPRHIRFEAALPREESGKIFKRKLREPYWAARARAI
ncbi:acyl-CoA synthetase [Roseomonas chloroacetimidivorans]|uniref:acyl-CoA synthetase n=1 Tax=Roseomonas chloroacetimidivorans TaxID=1766656 RepID=UPI003C77464D